MLGNGSGAASIRARALGALQVSQSRPIRAGVAQDRDRKNSKIRASRQPVGDCKAVISAQDEHLPARERVGNVLRDFAASLGWSPEVIPLSFRLSIGRRGG